jgi:O-acetyl-ADP-ribose deacetylase (regulator of RNase III)
MKIIKGDLIELAKKGEFDVIAHGCNCFCTQKSGIAKQMSEEFGTDKFPLETCRNGDINKLGNIDYKIFNNAKNYMSLAVVNCYTQYDFGRDKSKVYVDYMAITLCMKKINHIFKNARIGLPKIGCGLANGNWDIIKTIFEKELKDCDVTIVTLD